MDKNAALKSVKKYLDFLKVNKIDFQKAYVFGSYASGNFNENSDIDLAIVFTELSNSFFMQVELMKLGRKIDSRIEPHPFEEAEFTKSNPFANEVITKGIPVI